MKISTLVLFLLSSPLFARIATISTHQVSANKLIILLGDVHEPLKGEDHSGVFFSNLEKQKREHIKFLIEGGEQMKETSQGVPSFFLKNFMINNMGFPTEIAKIFMSILYQNETANYDVEDCNFRREKFVKIPEQIMQLNTKTHSANESINIQKLIQDEIDRVNQTLISLENIDTALTAVLGEEIDRITEDFNKMLSGDINIIKFLNKSFLDLASLTQDIDTFHMALSSPAKVVIFYGGFEHTKTMRKISSLMKWKEGFYSSEDEGLGLYKGFELLDKEVDTFLNSLEVKHGCKICGEKEKTLLNCGNCKNAKYCSQVCQRKDWPLHKLYCKSPK